MARPISIEDLYEIKFLGQPRISPDGQRIAFVASTIDKRKHEYRSSVWVVPTHGGEARRFTSASAHADSPSWSPDGYWLAFVSKRESEQDLGKEAKKRGKDKAQIWLIPADGGEARQLTFMEHGAASPTWSPNGKYVLFKAHVGPADEETEDGKVLPKVRVINQIWYRLDGVGFIYERRSHLFLADVASGAIEQLTDGDWDDGDATWSPDGSHIAFVSDRSEERWRSVGADVYTLAIQDGKAGELRCLTDGSLFCGSPSWSPDGQTIAFLAQYKLHPANHTYLYATSADVNRAAATCLSHDFEGSCMDETNSDIGDNYLSPAPNWSSDGKALYVLASHRGASRIFALSSTGENAQPLTLTAGEVHVRDVSVDASKRILALLLGNPTCPQEIFVCSVDQPGDLRRITGFNDVLFDELTLTMPEYMPFEGEDGWPIDGWIMKPHDFDPSKKYPLILQIHGGPQTQYGYGFFHEMQVLAGQGYVVFYTNPRGSCGYGYDFALAVRGAWGEKDSLDIMHGVDALLQRGYIDEQRMGVIGGSYGGFMTNWLIGHTDRFRAAVTDRCVSNMASMFGTSDMGWKIAYENLEVMPGENWRRYIHMSPINYIQHIHTPLLILHSEQDLRCNIEQAEQLFTALKWMGREVLFVRFEGQSHGLSRNGHPKARLERLRHIKAWFEKYLK
ncbi:MAG: S9 family peptidase [Ktedonobacteraceae bacterium]|nr:S9 family peptidase [Ktedonobacteraceae bacterium]